MKIKEDAYTIIEHSISEVLPDNAVKKALKNLSLSNDGKLVLVAIGKAAWQMANAACEVVGNYINNGIVITKYGHVKHEIPGIKCLEAGHPVPDENCFSATRQAIELVSGLTEKDNVLFLVSGGGSALFELPLIPDDELQSITSQMLANGMDIVSMNVIRKRLSAVKGGKFAQICSPAHVYTIILSDIIGDPLDMIASGPTAPDSSTCEDAVKLVKEFKLELSAEAEKLMLGETPKELDNTEYFVTGSVSELCLAAREKAEELGYESVIITDRLACEARDAGAEFADIAVKYAGCGKKKAFIMGGETVVHLIGSGKGGRNQEMALSCALGIQGLQNCVMFSVGSDGSDGPTDAAGGIVDGGSAGLMEAAGLSPEEMLSNNDSYNALKAADSLIITGSTGTNVNDLSVLLIGDGQL